MTFQIPSADWQLQFLHKLQQLLEEGGFTATYKFALLLALADIAVEKGDVGGAPLTITSHAIAEKYINYYWRQALPFPGSPPDQTILLQNTGKQAAIINRISAYQTRHGTGFAHARKQRAAWNQLVRQIAGTVSEMPLWRLQTFAHGEDDFLYPNTRSGDTITLRPGIAFCLRAFHGQILNMVQGAWLRWIRGLKGNQVTLGQTVDLNEFLFGSERANLVKYVPILQEQQTNRCFYCRGQLKSDSMEVDHFIPWARYPIDLGHNFVLADRGCNHDKRDLLPAISHLERWVTRNLKQPDILGEYFDYHDLFHDRNASHAIATWAYTQVEMTNGDVWQAKKGEVIALSPEWRELLPNN